jgi:hypothetical protein
VVDVFDEVEEQLRSERYRTLAVKSLPWVGAAAAAVVISVGGYWGWNSYQTNQANKASESYQAALETAQKQGPAQAFGQFKSVADGGAKGYKALALLQMGDIRMEENKTKEAVAYFDEAAKAAPSPVLGDLARLKSAFALMDTASYKDIESRLTPLMGEKSPYRVYAKEALAFAKLQAGDLARRARFLRHPGQFAGRHHLRRCAPARPGRHATDRLGLGQGSGRRREGRGHPAGHAADQPTSRRPASRARR